eukprot:11412683-Alexandrium_andersonii.AAC.1
MSELPTACSRSGHDACPDHASLRSPPAPIRNQAAGHALGRSNHGQWAVRRPEGRLSIATITERSM